MTNQSQLAFSQKYPRVWGVDDVSCIDLSDNHSAIELFVQDQQAKHFHIFRFILETLHGSLRLTSEGILLGVSSSEDRPKVAQWSGSTDTLLIESYICLGTESVDISGNCPFSMAPSGHINDDPIIFINFDPKTITARFLNSTRCVPEQVRERHLSALPRHAMDV